MSEGFKRCHPVVNILALFSVIIFGMLFLHPVFLTVSFLSSLIYYISLKGKFAVHRTLCFLLPMLLLVTLINGYFCNYGVTPLFVLHNGNSVTLESVVFGFTTGLMVVNVLQWFFCYNEVVTTDKFMHVFGKRLPKAALVMSMALRFVPMYSSRLKIISEAQQGIGKDYKSGSLLVRIKNLGQIISILITWALENAVETADSMKARGYGLPGRKSFSRFRWNRRDTLLCVLIVLLDVIVVLGAALKLTFAQYNPYIIINPSVDTANTYYINNLNIEINKITPFAIITMSAYALLNFLPIIIDIKEDIKWNRLKSRV